MAENSAISSAQYDWKTVEAVLQKCKVPQEMIHFLQQSQVKMEALDSLTTELSREPVILKRKYQGVKVDGKASEFLYSVYGEEIRKGLMDVSVLRAIDLRLYRALHKEVELQNKNHIKQISVSDFISTKQNIISSRKEKINRLFPDYDPVEVLVLFHSVLNFERYHSSN